MPYAMSNSTKAVVGALAMSLGALGAAQFAFGHDLSDRSATMVSVPDSAVNRIAKTDRSARVTTPSATTHTISLQLNGVNDTTVVMRMPMMQDARKSSETPVVTTSGPQKHVVACEAMVSVLTDIAKQLPPGRCVT